MPRAVITIFGVPQLIRDLRMVRRAQARGVQRGLMKAAAFLLEKSREVVPIDTKALHDSSLVRREGVGFNTKAVVSYSATSEGDYAVYVHEDLSMRHDPGRTAKYLERPARENLPEIGRIVRREALIR